MRVQKKLIETMARMATVALAMGSVNVSMAAESRDYDRDRWDPIHFKPAIEQATDEQCLACHQEILTAKPLEQSQAGVKAADTQAWYQTLDTYQGSQEDFHVRHMNSSYAKQVMDLHCNSCHQGNDPREEAVVPPTSTPVGYNLRKAVDPSDTCLRCHGKFPSQVIGLPGPWTDSAAAFNNDCLTCHAAIRTNRHNVSYLKPDAIEAAAKSDGADVCYGCHGGRSWYRISYPYPRHAWDGMPQAVPDWAKDRPTESDARFRK